MSVADLSPGDLSNRPSAGSKPSQSSESFVNTPFAWGVGVECSFLPHINVDQFEWTQHDRFWRDDLKKVRETLGVTTMRYALPWHKIELEPGKFDWSMADERINYCRDLGINLMMDVMHFGTPKWLPQAVGDPLFPEALERFTTAMVERYRDRISTWCPFNEPLVSALFSGDFGFWPPYARKWRGYMPVLSRIVQAVSRSIAAIRRAQPEATVMLCDAFENFQSKSPQLQNEVKMRNLRRFLVLDLISGKMDHHHPLFQWITSFGFSELDLGYLKNNPQLPDLIGIDYYPHSDWQIELKGGAVRQRRADAPLGIYELGRAIYDRYALPMMVTETSVDGPPISREIWLQTMTDGIKQLREEGIPLTGMIWWPVFDQIDWDGALLHRIGKLHRVGLFTLDRQPDGTLKRTETPLAKAYRSLVESGDEHVGKLEFIALPVQSEDPQLPPLLTDASQWINAQIAPAARQNDGHANGHTNGNGKAAVEAVVNRISAEPAPGLSTAAEKSTAGEAGLNAPTTKATDKYGIVVFSHLRWGFVWQRPQQFLSRFARFHPVLFVEEPFFDLAPGSTPRYDLHRVLPNVTVFCPHAPPESARGPKLLPSIRGWVKEAMDTLNTRGEFDQPLLWYYSPMDSSWSLGHFANRGIVYDSMDELSQFTGAPKELIDNEKRLMVHADVVFTGGYELWLKKSAQHPNAHFYGCGVEFDHFNKASDPATSVPPDVDFLTRPIIGWFGVVDERVDYHLLAEVARMRPDWTLAVVGPVVKIDPNLLPHSPNLHWLGGRDYSVLPNYCKAFDVCMMAFAINKATEFINPTKALEYMATGKPVISTPVKDVLRQYTDIVEIAATPAEFVEKVEKMLESPDQKKIEAGLALAKKNSWEGTVAAMRGNIKEAITGSTRRSSKITPLPDPEPGFFFKHTPGS
jgi:beta-glucosidase/6-phospho-beta-glucosidase/beta-galactosidase/glycosyltransferase involved in cell wall biosynthesis